MTSTFKKKKAFFESKHQIAPNALIFNRDLDDSCVRLLLCLNALPESWTPIQNDICERLGWGRDKMRKWVGRCVELGYMKVTQSREPMTQGGQKTVFAYNQFEWDLEPSYLDSSNSSCVTGFQSSETNSYNSNKGSQMTWFQSTEDQSTETPALPNTRIDLRKERQQQDAGADAPSVAVLSSKKDKEEEKTSASLPKLPCSKPSSVAPPPPLPQWVIDEFPDHSERDSIRATVHLKKYDLSLIRAKFMEMKKKGRFDGTPFKWLLWQIHHGLVYAVQEHYDNEAKACLNENLKRSAQEALVAHKFLLDRHKVQFRVLRPILEEYERLADKFLAQLPNDLQDTNKPVAYNLLDQAELTRYKAQLSKIQQLIRSFK